MQRMYSCGSLWETSRFSPLVSISGSGWWVHLLVRSTRCSKARIESEVFIHLPLVFFSETVFEAAAVFEHEVEDAGVAFQSSADLLDTFTSVGFEQSVEDFLGLVHRRDRASRDLGVRAFCRSRMSRCHLLCRARVMSSGFCGRAFGQRLDRWRCCWFFPPPSCRRRWQRHHRSCGRRVSSRQRGRVRADTRYRL